MNALTLSRALGWFSVALGAAELLAGRRMAQVLGVEHRTPLVRLFGLREILVGIGILQRPTSPALLWARVGGDALDLAALAAALRYDNPRRTEVDVAMAAVAAVTVLDILCGYRLQEREARRHRISMEARARIAGAA
ncbi:MAG: hypothetical protein ICV73_14570 [Acetobacteraceae bacterium]|nr:hypothetical protein [Acetobacteraceae bacterium]